MFLNKSKIFKGKSVYLRLPEKRRLSFIYWLWLDNETMKELRGSIKGHSIQKLEEWYRKMVYSGKTTYCYCLIFNNHHQPIGEISFHKLNLQTMTAYLNIKSAANCRGEGYA